MEDDADSPRMISYIVEKVFQRKKYSNAEFAYVVAICKTILDPENGLLQLEESTMKRKVKKYLVSFVICSTQVNISLPININLNLKTLKKKINNDESLNADDDNDSEDNGDSSESTINEE